MTTPSAASTLPKIAIISFENEAGTAVRADSYFATLESTYWKLSNYTDDIAGASLPNYCAVTSGSILNRTTDTTSTGTPPMPMNANNLYHQLEGAGLTWKSYAHGLSGTTDTATTYGGGLSIGKHDPASFYTTTKTSTNHTGFRSLVTDITNKTLPDFCFITPTLKEDGHDTNVAYASNWLQGKNPEAVASQEAFPGLDALLTAMGPAATVVIWWDEGSGGNDYSVVCGPNWVGHTVTASAMDHFRLLRSVQAAFNLTPFTTTGVTGTSIDARYSGSGTVLDLSVTPGGGGGSLNPLSVSIGPYTASSYATTTAEEALLTADMASHPALPTWYFGRLDVSLPVAYNDGRLLIFNISVSSGGVGRSWSSIAAGTYDAGLTTVLNSVHAMTSTTVYLSIFQEADGGAAQNADIANGGSGSHADFAAAFAHIAALAAIHCPNATITQNYASSTHLSTWAVCPAAQALGFDPHNYFGNTTAFSTFLSATQTALNNAGQGSTPWIINTGVAEEAIGGSDKADWFTAMFTALWDAKTAYPHLVFATYWNTDSANINGHPATESIDSAGTNPGALAAYKAGLATLYGGSGPPPPPPPVGAGVNLCLWVGGAAWHEVPSPEYSAATWYQQKLNRAFVVRPRGAYGTSWPAGVASNTPLIKWPTQLGVFAKQQFGGYSTNIKFFTDDPAGTNPDGTPKNPPADTLAHLLQGNYDSWLAAQVGDLKTLAGQGVTVWCEIWSEMNVATPNSAQPAASDGPWVAASGGGNITFGTGGTVERFRDFYCYIVNFFDAAGVSNVRWVASLSSNKTTTWGGTVGGGTNASSTDIQVFIDPILAKETTDGKRYIDVIGNDMYNRAGNNFSPTTMYGPGLAAAKLRHKPFGIFECGKTEAPAGASAAVLAQKGQWYTDIGTFCTANDADMEFFAFTCSERFFPPEEYVDPFDGTVANIDPRNGYGSPSWTSFLAMTQLPVFNTTTGKHFGAARLSGTGTFRATGGVTTVHRSGAARLSGVGTLVANAFAPGLSRRNASSGSTSGHSITPAFNTATLAGSTVVLALWVSGGSTAPTVLTAPSGSATYTLGLSYTEPNQGFGLFVYYLFNSVATEPAFTVAFSTGVTYIEYSMAELVGLTTTDPLDLTRATVGSGTPESVFGPALATAQHSEWAMAVLGNVAGTSPSAPTNGYVLSGTAPVVARLLAGFKPLSTGTETLGFSVTGGNATARYAGGVLTFEALNGDPGITNWYGAATLTGRGLLPTATGQRGIIGRTDSANLHGVGTLSATGVKAGTSLNGSATLYGFSGFRATAKTVTPATGEVLLRISDFPRAIQKG